MNYLFTALILGWLALPVAAQTPDLLLADFEGTNYGAWRVTGTAFGPGPARGALPGQMAVSGYRGKGLVNSFFQGDRATGTLTSPPFKIERKHLKFLIGGGGFTNQTCLNLLLDGQVRRTATGPNLNPGGSEQLAWQAWEVGEFSGREAVLEIVDRATGGWGHINVDHILQSDQPLPKLVANARREFTAQRRYLLLPVKNGAPKRWVSLSVGGRVERDFNLELADAGADWWAFLDLAPFQGRPFTIEVDQLPDDSAALKSLELSDTIRSETPIYQEALRPQFHFSPRRGWNNDPNGLVYFDGEYHLFFQHNPYGWNWGNMHWGQAVSRDLVHWQELPEALYPDALGTMFSGSAVVDERNAAGFNQPGRPAIVLFYTAAGGDNRLSKGQPFTQCLAYSTDRGRTWAKYDRNPILGNLTGGNRDPKVIWHAPSSQWIMTLYVETNKTHTIQFFGSKNLRDWQYLSRTDGFFECPDFFELPVAGWPGRRLWLLTGASSEYMLGHFDGVAFQPVTGKLPGHRGRGFYAAQTYSDIPARDGRRIQVGWLQAPSPNMPFNQCMSLPLELRLLATPEGARLAFEPVRELAALRSQSLRLPPFALQADTPNPLAKSNCELLELCAEFTPGDTAVVRFKVRGAAISYDAQKRELSVNDQRVPVPGRGHRVNLAVYCDRTTLEVFAADGLVYVPMPFIPKAENRELSVTIEAGRAQFHALEVHALKPAWP